MYNNVAMTLPGGHEALFVAEKILILLYLKGGRRPLPAATGITQGSRTSASIPRLWQASMKTGRPGW